MFASMVAAETAYREQVALNQSLSTKFDELGSKIDALTSVMTQLVSKLDALAPAPTNPRLAENTTFSPPAEEKPEQSELLPVLPFPSGDARNYDTSRSPAPPTGLRELPLPRSCSDSAVGPQRPINPRNHPVLRPLQLPKIVSDSTMDDFPKRDRKSITAQRVSIFGPPRRFILCSEPETSNIVPLESQALPAPSTKIDKLSSNLCHKPPDVHEDEGYFSDSEHVPTLRGGKASSKFSLSRGKPIVSSIPYQFLPRAKNLQRLNFKSRRKQRQDLFRNV